MRRKQLQIWFLLVYLILFWNLGPSFHHADSFGLHAHCGPSSCCRVHDAGNSCCYFHNHNHGLKCDPEHSPVTPSESEVKPHHDCSLCQFFDDFNGTVESYYVEVEVSLVSLANSNSLIGWQGVTFTPIARGPPLV